MILLAAVVVLNSHELQHQRIGRPKPIAAYRSLAEERRGSASRIFNTPEPSLADPRHCIETDVPQNDNDVEMNIDVDTSGSYDFE